MVSSDHRGHHGAVRRESSALNMIAYKLYLVCLPMAKHRCKSEVSLFIGCEGNGLCNPRTIRTASDTRREASGRTFAQGRET